LRPRGLHSHRRRNRVGAITAAAIRIRSATGTDIGASIDPVHVNILHAGTGHAPHVSASIREKTDGDETKTVRVVLGGTGPGKVIAGDGSSNNI